MSRFYDALKEASRARNGDGNPHNPEWEALGTSLSEVPVLDDAVVKNETVVTHPPDMDHAAASPQEPADVLLAEGSPKINFEALHEDLLDLAAIKRTEAVAPPKPPLPSLQANVEVGTDPQLSAVTADALPEQVVSEPKVKPLPSSPLKPKNEISFDPSARLIPHAVNPAVLEHYRRLRTKVLQQHAEKPFQSLLVTSPNPQEGKTVTVLNLGLSFAMLPNFRVLVIDGDLRRGSIGKWLGVNEYSGLSDLLEGTVELEDVVLKGAGIPMHVMTSGNSKLSPAELLHSPRLAEQFGRMTGHFDLVLVDSPPVTMITDAQLLGGSCDAVLLIARAFSTTRKSLEQAVQDLSAFRLIGTVLNGGTRAQLNHRYKGYY
jgi:capsular exopolysaccharide synthesis family protein